MLLKTFKTDIIGRAQSITVQFQFFLVLFPVGTWCFVENILNFDITGRPNSVTVSFHILNFVSIRYWCFVENVRDCYMK